MEDKYNMKQLFIFVILVLIILGIFYGITVLITERNNSSKSKETDTETVNDEDITIDYDTILIQNIYSQKEDTYYVLASFEDDENISTYEENISEYKESENALKVYNADMNSAFNQKYVSETSNFDEEYPTISETTLFKINNKKIEEKYQGDEITTALSNLIEK